MHASGTTVCLCMIVKDEAHVIRRCLASVRPLLDHWVVVDTGSSDGTQDIVRAAMAGLPGEVVERSWVDFAHNRSEALALARPHADYSLIIDADDELVLAPDYALPALDADSYTIDIHYGATTYRRPQLVRNALAWRYRGVLHEFLECADSKTQDNLPIVMKINHEGRRSTDPTTYAKDAAVLATALASETDPFLVSRYTFYLAQSYRDCGEREKALDHYLRRATLGFWIEEVYVSLLQAGRLMEALGREPDEIVATYRRASEAVPTRAEAAHAASRFCRGLLRFQQGYELAKAAAGLLEPPGGLFVEGWIYDYGLCDELAVNAYWAGRHRACLDACLRALQGGKVPAFELARFYANMRFALDNLPEVAPDRETTGVVDRHDDRQATAPSPGEVVEAPPIAFAGTFAAHRDRYCLWIVTPANYEHHHAFDDVAESLSEAFATLGGSAPIVRSDADFAGRVPIVLGAHLLSFAGVAVPADAVIFNFEQIGATHSPWTSDAYLALLRRHAVLDYSLANIRALESAGLRHAVHLPVRGMPKLGAVDVGPEREIDVLFYGSINPRRAAILEALRARGLVVVEQFGIYGAARDAAIARAKVVLNLHYYDTTMFEAVRVAHLLANGACVVSEGRADDPDCADLADGLVLCAYDALVAQCVDLVEAPARRAALAERARAVIARRTQADILEAMFERPR